MSASSGEGEMYQEGFEGPPRITYYVITMGQPERRRNIQEQIDRQQATFGDRFPFQIEKIDAVVGKDLDLEALIAEGRLFDGIYANPDQRFNEKMSNRKNEVGCYMSHYKVYETIREKGDRDGYSVIFEDDFVLDPRFLEILDETMAKLQRTGVDFDMLFLGILGDVGEPIIDNVYRTTGISWCAHAYLVNNRHIDKILEQMWFIHNILDVQIFKKGNKGELQVLRLYPTIADQAGFTSHIRI